MAGPNILLFMTDQQHHATVAPDGPCRMPHVASLADRGVRCTRAFTPTPICTPARTSTLTGLYPHRHGLLQNAHAPLVLRDHLSREFTTLGDCFRQAGYQTGHAGKWHIGSRPPGQYGFETVPSGPAAPPQHLQDPIIHFAGEPQDRPLSAVTDRAPAETQPFRVAAQTRQLIQRFRQRDAARPFFIFASCNPPHVPWYVPEAYAHLHDPDQIAQPPSYRDDLADKPMTYRKRYNGNNFGPVGGDWPRLAVAVARYFGICTLIDDAFGTLLALLEQQGILEETVVIFTSDHGELLGAHGLVGKNELFCEELVRIPLVLAGPGIAQGQAASAPITLCDLFATLASLAGIDAVRPADSRDLSPVLAKPRGAAAARAAQEVFFQHHGATFQFNGLRGIRTPSYKYVYRPHERDELYDLAQDPYERINREEDNEYTEVLLRLRGRLLAWMRQNDDFMLRSAETTFTGIYGRVPHA